MKPDNPDSWLPPITTTATGQERCVGIEIEMAGLEPDSMTSSIQKFFNGEIREENRFKFIIDNTDLGDFIVELDSSFLKDLGDKLQQPENKNDEDVFDNISSYLLTKTAEQFVPWEIVGPPVPVSKLPLLLPLVDDLRKSGALGTRHAARFAFGVHMNPELPQLDAVSILNYLRAYFCLYDWIAEKEQIDLLRRITPYIDHFDDSYILQVIDPDYQPDISTLIDDYLLANPTRNRSMDMLPLFAHLDEKRVRKSLDDPRIKARPTLHYRLPNCDIDNPEWNLDIPWGIWLEVEHLAADENKLADICNHFQQDMKRLTRSMDKQWVEQTEQWLLP